MASEGRLPRWYRIRGKVRLRTAAVLAVILAVFVAVTISVVILLRASPPPKSGTSAGMGWVRACVTNTGRNGTLWTLVVDSVLERERYLSANETQCALGEDPAGAHLVQVRCDRTTLYNETVVFEAGAIKDLTAIGRAWPCP